MSSLLIAIVTLIFPWIVWLLIHKRESRGRLLLVGFFTIIVGAIFDATMVTLGFWHYKVTLVPSGMNFFIPWVYGLYPVMVMLLVQYKPTNSPYVKAIVFAIVSAFIIDPLYNWFNIFEPKNWEYYYGLPLFIVHYLLVNKLSKMKSFDQVS